MKKILTVRAAKNTEVEWVNKRYDEIEFVHSKFDKEIIAIAEMGGQKVGIGRLVTIDADHFELGGMYVFDSFRNCGVVSAIVDFLIKNTPQHRTVYCIPFEHLVSFYMRFGFAFCANPHRAPNELLDKYLWCKEKYPQPTSLLILKT